MWQYYTINSAVLCTDLLLHQHLTESKNMKGKISICWEREREKEKEKSKGKEIEREQERDLSEIFIPKYKFRTSLGPK